MQVKCASIAAASERGVYREGEVKEMTGNKMSVEEAGQGDQGS